MPEFVPELFRGVFDLLCAERGGVTGRILRGEIDCGGAPAVLDRETAGGGIAETWDEVPVSR